MKGNHDVYILNVGGEYRVRPAVMATLATNKLNFRNLTENTVVLVFPQDLMGTANVHTLPAKTSLKNIGFSGTPDGSYTYSVFAIDNGKPVVAAGESDPIIIIDP